ncbi:MAG TPA: hypothetical protein VH370_23155 [Humisphaera sp.]|jgi:hypothetical protein|nr:hypothetical protein [Humisphaera sp.]
MITKTFQNVSWGGQGMKSDCSEVSRRFRKELDGVSALSAISVAQQRRTNRSDVAQNVAPRCAAIIRHHCRGGNCAKEPRRQVAKNFILISFLPGVLASWLLGAVLLLFVFIERPCNIRTLRMQPDGAENGAKDCVRVFPSDFWLLET